MEREEMLEELRDLEKHLKLDDTIIQHFVPSEAVDMIQKVSACCLLRAARCSLLAAFETSTWPC